MKPARLRSDFERTKLGIKLCSIILQYITSFICMVKRRENNL